MPTSILNPGDVAPNFTLKNQWHKDVSLSDYAGKPVIVWWIPSTMADMTPACCDKIANGFGAAVAEHQRLNVIGLSFDSPELMRTFAMRGLVMFPLLSDETKEVGEAYGVRRGEGVDWDCFPLKRAFLVDPDGKIAKVYFNIDPDYFVPEVVADVTPYTEALSPS